MFVLEQLGYLVGSYKNINVRTKVLTLKCAKISLRGTYKFLIVYKPKKYSNFSWNFSVTCGCLFFTVHWFPCKNNFQTSNWPVTIVSTNRNKFCWVCSQNVCNW